MQFSRKAIKTARHHAMLLFTDHSEHFSLTKQRKKNLKLTGQTFSSLYLELLS